MNPEEEEQNYRPSRFLLKKQQALIQQGFFHHFPLSHFHFSSKIKILKNR